MYVSSYNEKLLYLYEFIITIKGKMYGWQSLLTAEWKLAIPHLNIITNKLTKRKDMKNERNESLFLNTPYLSRS